MNTYITYWNYEPFPLRKKELRSKQCKRMDLNEDVRKPSIAASFGDGRTANQLCNFASGYALWKQYGILNFLDEHQYELLSKTFDLPKLDEESDNSSYYIWRKGRYLNVMNTILMCVCRDLLIQEL